MWSAKLFGVHSHLVLIAYKNVLRSGPPIRLTIIFLKDTKLHIKNWFYRMGFKSEKSCQFFNRNSQYDKNSRRDIFSNFAKKASYLK